MKRLILLSLILLIVFPFLAAAQEDFTCASYFTGIGCPYCARVDQLVLQDSISSENLIIIEYEIYHQAEPNADIYYSFFEENDFPLGVPQLVFSENSVLRGANTIKNNIQEQIETNQNNICFAPETNSNINSLDLNSLPGKPKIWIKDKILIRTSQSITDKQLLTNLILSENPAQILNQESFSPITPEEVELSGRSIEFENAVQLQGWIFQWNGESVNSNGDNPDNPDNPDNEVPAELTLPKIISLAIVDAINPCALAVLTLMLIAIMSYNPNNKKNILFSGLAFTSSVFIIYLIYGLILIKFFQVLQFLAPLKIILYKILGAIAIILGILNLKDYIKYKPGSFGTEMPLSLRPKLKKIISKITSPKGAFIIGAFVTLFLLPCTIGPYVIASGILSFLNILKTLPWLTLYNLIFVIPMIIITLLVYLGLTRTKDVSNWKDKNIRILHLISGLIMFILGIAIFFGLF